MLAHPSQHNATSITFETNLLILFFKTVLQAFQKCTVPFNSGKWKVPVLFGLLSKTHSNPWPNFDRRIVIDAKCRQLKLRVRNILSSSLIYCRPALALWNLQDGFNCCWLYTVSVTLIVVIPLDFWKYRYGMDMQELYPWQRIKGWMRSIDSLQTVDVDIKSQLINDETYTSGIFSNIWQLSARVCLWGLLP